jgi:cytoskeleton protein RodZ
MNESGNAAAQTTEGLGRMLSRWREERGLAIVDVAQRLKYGAKQIEALEAEQFDKLPGATFVRGMVRSYAKLLGIEQEPLLAALERQYTPGEITLDLRAKGVPFARSGRHGTRIYLLFSLLVLIMAGVAYQWRIGTMPWAKWLPKVAQPAQKKESAASAPPAPAPAAPVAHAPEAQAPAAPAAATPVPPKTVAVPMPPPEGRIRLEFDGESWVEIRDKDGKMLVSQLNSAGSRKVVVGSPPMSLVIGNATAVRLTYNDKAIDLKPYIQIEVARLTLQ